MRGAVVAIGFLFLLAVPAAHANDNDDVDAALKSFAEAFNKGDMNAARALQAPPPVGIGLSQLDKFAGDLARLEVGRGNSNGKVTVGPPSHEAVFSADATASAPSTYTYQRNGVTMREKGEFWFRLVKQEGVWKISQWNWTE